MIVVGKFLAMGGLRLVGDEGYGVGKGLIVFQGMEAGAEEVLEKVEADGAGAGLALAVATGEAKDGLAGLRQEGESQDELLELAGVSAAFERVEVAFGGTSAGAPTAARFGC